MTKLAYFYKITLQMCKPNIHNNSGEQVPPIELPFPTDGKCLITIANAPPPLERVNIKYFEKINTVRNGYR